MGQAAPLEVRFNKLFSSRLLRQDHRGKGVGGAKTDSHEPALPSGKAARPGTNLDSCFTKSLCKERATNMRLLLDAPQQTDLAVEVATLSESTGQNSER